MNKISTALIAVSLICGGSTVLADDARHDKEDMTRKMDTNNDGVISKNEYTRYHENKWQKLDKDNDGKVSTAELQKMHEGKMHHDSSMRDKDKNKSPNY